MESLPWPALAWDEHVWEPSGSGVLFRAEQRAVGRTYRAAVPPYIREVSLELPGAMAGRIDEATAALTRVDASFPGEVGSIAAVLLRSESASSSQIENITASARAVAEAEQGGGKSRNGALVAANAAAMIAAIDLAEALDADAILSMQRALLASSAPGLLGWRTDPVWIGSGSSTPVEADYVAPHHSRIEPLIEDLVSFMARDDLPVVAQAALAHAQFETIHPFADGNGRTGRALVQAMLRAKKVTRHVTVPVSGGLLHRRDGYIDALTAYRAGDAGPIIESFARAALHGAAQGAGLVEEVRRIRASWDERIVARSDSGVWPLLNHLVAHPVMTAGLAAELLGILPTNAARLLGRLLDAGIVIARADYRTRTTFYRSPEILAALDAYAALAGRRRPS